MIKKNILSKKFFLTKKHKSITYWHLIHCITLFFPNTTHATNFAENNNIDDELKFLVAERQIVVTASKQEENVSKTIATTSVITQEDIRQIGARNLLDTLKLVPGIGITESMLGIREIEVRGIKSLASE